MASVSSPPASIPCVNFSEIGQQPIRQLFLENGFLRVDGLFSGEEVAQMKAAMAAIVEGFDPAEHPTTTFNTKDEQKHVKDRYFLESVDKIRFFYEEGAVDQQQGSGGRLLVPKERALNKVGHALHWLDPVFRRFTFHERIKQLCLLLDVQSPRVVQSMYIFKQPRIGGDVDEHVDSTFLHTREPQNLLGIWIALDAAREENGCLWFAPGSHKDLASIEPNKRYKFVRNEDAISRGGDRPLLKFIGTKQPCSDGTNERHFVPVECESGSLLLIHGDVLHRSASNKSERPRHAYTFHLVDFGREWNGEWAESNWLQETEEYKFPELFVN